MEIYMSDSFVLEALFIQQRLQILSMADSFPDFYVYAWEEGIYPYLEDTDGTVVRKPHEPYESCFRYGRLMVKSVTEFIDGKWINNETITFRDLERQFKGYEPHKLQKVCRYLFLKGAFDDELWNSFITPQCSSSAYGIKADYDSSSIYFI
jgi:antitoxin MazE